MASTWEPALHELAGPRYARLVAHAAVLCGDRAAAEDLVQDALVRTFSKPRRFASVPQAEQYVRLAIASVFIDRTRRERRERQLWSRAAGTLAVDGPSLSGVDTDTSRALLTLAPRVRACIVLRFLEDLSTRDTAAALGLSEGAVKRYVADGVRALAGELGVADVPDYTEHVPVGEGGGQ